jgi:DNA-binding MarR family transcriptional regulator
MNNQLLMKIIHTYNLVNRTMEKSNGRFPRTQGMILKILSKHGGMPQKDLAACLQVSEPSVSQLITKMAAGGYIQRGENDKDKRLSLIETTPEGKTAALKLQESSEAGLNALFSSLSDEEKEQFSILLSKVISDLDNEKDRCVHSFCEKCGLCTQGYGS